MLYHSIRMNGSLPVTISRDTRNGQDAEQLIALFRTLADPIRLRIVRLLESYSQLCGSGIEGAAGSPGGLSVGELGQILKLPQSTVSRHLKILTDSCLAEPRRDGTSTFYHLLEPPNSPDAPVVRQLRQLARTHLDHDSTAQNDSHRLASVLRNRESPHGSSESFFGKHAPQWDHLRDEWFGDTFHLEGALALLNPDWNVADIGTGTGAMLPLLSPHVKNIIAVDPSPAMLKGARNRIRELALSNVDMRQGTAEHLPIDSRTMDVALLALVLAYTADPEMILKEVHRILKPGGVVLILDLQPHTVELFREKLNHRWMGFSQEQLAQWLKSGGFSGYRWHPLTPSKSRAKAPSGRNHSAMPIPDLFAMRAQVVDKN
jgi:ubiquinone/menaquinone biosynthesis C-methylase UbiE/DNA-binding transcriptional ArsR family regulator